MQNVFLTYLARINGSEVRKFGNDQQCVNNYLYKIKLHFMKCHSLTLFAAIATICWAAFMGCGKSKTVNKLTTTTATITTTSINSITDTTASGGGNVISDGGAAVTERGVCWNTSPGPTAAMTTKTLDDTGTGSYTSRITGLNAGATYYVRAYATNSAGTAYGSEFTFTTPIGIGSRSGGGIVAYILQPGDTGFDPLVTHGLIAAPTDQNENITWYNGSNNVTGATGTGIGTGSANTNAIIAIQGVGSYAASVCRYLALGGYSDWYLPGKDELNKLFLNRAAIGGFASSAYWSSSEVSITFVWFQDFVHGEQISNGHKDGGASVRAVRSF